MFKITVDNLWIQLGQVSAELGQHVNNYKVTHSLINSSVGYAQILPELYTTLVHTFFARFNRSHYVFIPVVHTTNNYYYINK